MPQLVSVTAKGRGISTNAQPSISGDAFSDQLEAPVRNACAPTMKPWSAIRRTANRSYASKLQNIVAKGAPRLLRTLAIASLAALSFSGAQANTASPDTASSRAASLNAASPTPGSANPAFATGSRVANSGRGFSTYATLTPRTFRVECNCADFSLDTRICTSTSYQCHCTPRAALTCQ